MKAFGPDTVKAAAKYLDDGAHYWVRERSCLACHSTGVYMVERSALTKQLGKPSEEVLKDFIASVPKAPGKPGDGDAATSVWRSSGLASWDRHVEGKLSEHTDRSLRHTVMILPDDNMYDTIKLIEIPYITTRFELTVQAMRAMVTAPGWLANLKDAELLARVERIKKFLREHQPLNDYELALKLQLANLMPELVSKEERDAAIAMLWRKQLPDGGWSTRRMSDLLKWRLEVHPPTERQPWKEAMDPTVVALIQNLPDAANPGSDPYMTAFAIVLLRESGVPASDQRIQRGIALAEGEPARERPLVDVLAVPRQLQLHHLHQHRTGVAGTGAVRRVAHDHQIVNPAPDASSLTLGGIAVPDGPLRGMHYRTHRPACGR